MATPVNYDEPEVELRRHVIGNALVVHRAAGISDAAKALALRVAEDVEHDLVVVDLPVGAPISVWESVAGLLPRRRRGLRLVIGGRSRETTALAGQWLAERLRRNVIAPDGTVFAGAGGSLFVHSGQNSGWIRFAPGRPPRWEAKRFPRPSWDADAGTDLMPTSALGVAEPLPGGIWIRPTGGDRQLRAHRTTLIDLMSCQPDVLTVVLGSPGLPALPLDDAARQWARLPVELREQHTRFVMYGPSPVDAGRSPGQALADLLRTEVSWYTGLPIGNGPVPMISTVRHDGRFGWWQYARQLAYRPADSGPPALRDYRPPLRGLNEVAPAVYWYAPDAVIEVVQSGLLLRPPAGGDHGASVRTLQADPAVHNLSFDTSAVASADRMRALATDLLARLEPATRRASRLVPAAALVAERSRVRVRGPAPAALATTVRSAVPAAPAAQPALSAEQPTQVLHRQAEERTGRLVRDEPTRDVADPAVPLRLESAAAPGAPAVDAVTPPVTVSTAAPVESAGVEPPVRPAWTTPEPTGPRDRPSLPAAAPDEPPSAAVPSATDPPPTGRQPTPEPSAAALLPEKGVDDERAWLRRTLGPEFGTMSNAVARVLSEHPGFQGVLSQSSDEVLTDAVALRLYLSDRGATVDPALRAGTVGAHVPLARCVVAGLSRLPSHRGPSVLGASSSPALWELYRANPVVTEWGFLNALTKPYADLPGDTDVVVWSMTARRTKLLELPDGVADRVLFVPGTRFKVLEATQPDADSRGRVLLRELTAGEVDEDGRAESGPVPLDELAITTMHREHEKWAAATQDLRLGRSAIRFGALPGLA